VDVGNYYGLSIGTATDEWVDNKITSTIKHVKIRAGLFIYVAHKIQLFTCKYMYLSWSSLLPHIVKLLQLPGLRDCYGAYDIGTIW